MFLHKAMPPALLIFSVLYSILNVMDNLLDEGIYEATLYT